LAWGWSVDGGEWSTVVVVMMGRRRPASNGLSRNSPSIG
jgi:hypothetical protein